jgi:hypothetical protein
MVSSVVAQYVATQAASVRWRHVSRVGTGELPDGVRRGRSVNRVGARVGVGTRFRYYGETVEVIEMAITATGNCRALTFAMCTHHGSFGEDLSLIPDGH